MATARHHKILPVGCDSVRFLEAVGASATSFVQARCSAFRLVEWPGRRPDDPPAGAGHRLPAMAALGLAEGVAFTATVAANASSEARHQRSSVMVLGKQPLAGERNRSDRGKTVSYCSISLIIRAGDPDSSQEGTGSRPHYRGHSVRAQLLSRVVRVGRRCSLRSISGIVGRRSGFG